MQNHFLAPHMAELRLSNATLLSEVGMSNSAIMGVWMGPQWHLQHCRSRTPGCHLWLPSCRACSRLYGAIDADCAQFIAHINSQVGPWCQEFMLELLDQSWDPHGSGLGLSLLLNKHHAIAITCRPQASTESHLCPTYILLWKLFWVVLDGCKPWACSLMHKLYIEIPSSGEFWLSLLTQSIVSQRIWCTQKSHHLQWAQMWPRTQTGTVLWVNDESK